MSMQSTVSKYQIESSGDSLVCIATFFVSWCCLALSGDDGRVVELIRWETLVVTTLEPLLVR